MDEGQHGQEEYMHHVLLGTGDGHFQVLLDQRRLQLG